MYEELYAPLPDKEAYLERIGLLGAALPHTAETLHKLIYANLTHIPFENLEVYEDNACPNLSIEGLFNKIIVRRRGGYCFELNGLFCALLEALGFTCYQVIGRVLHGRTFIPNPTHRGTVVELPEGRYYCDVGFGGAASFYPVPMKGEETPDGYYISVEGRNLVVNRRLENGYERALMFADYPAYAVDFVPLNFHIAMAPDSYFRIKPMVNLTTETGNIAIDGNIFRRRHNGACTEQVMETREDFLAVLKAHFGIVLDA